MVGISMSDVRLLPLHRWASGLMRGGASSLDSTEKPVRNTFIHYNDNEEEEQPVISKFVSNLLDGMPLDWSQSEEITDHIETIKEGYRRRSSVTSNASNFEEDRELNRSSSEDIPVPATAAAMEPAVETPEAQIAVAPLRNMVAGSDVHKEGRCKPCAWHWKPSGCSKGDNCSHCHLCPPDAMRKKRKDRLERMKMKKRERAAAAHEQQDEEETGTIEVIALS